MSTCGAANSFGWVQGIPPIELWESPLQFHYDGGAVFVERCSKLSPALRPSRLWWRLTGIARERMRGSETSVQMIGGEPVLLPAAAVMGAEMIAPEQRNVRRDEVL